MSVDHEQIDQAAEEKQLVLRILDSELFRKSHRTADFLRFIFSLYSQGQASSINEQRIGIEVFGRQPGYNAGDDSIVRSQARYLRTRLEEYFVSEGKHEPLILEIPKGSYVPVFKRPAVKAIEPPPPPITAEPSSPATNVQVSRNESSKPARPWRTITVAIVAVLLVVSALFFYNRAQSQSTEASVLSSFWSTIFARDRSVILVPADGVLVALQQAIGEDISLQSYINKDYLQQKQIQPFLSGIVHTEFTNIIDVYLIARLVRIPEAEAIHPQIRFARDLSLKELKNSNAILIGSRRVNPWVEMFASTVGLQVDYDYASGHNVVRNNAHGNGELPLYVSDNSGTSIAENHQYGVIIYTSSLDNAGHTLLIEGTTKAGTEAAGEFLEGPSFVTFLERIKGNASTIPNFELLIASGDVNDSSYHPTLVCWHLLRPSVSRPLDSTASPR